MIKGIDVSDNNGKVDWKKVKEADVQFAILRLGYGSDYTKQDDKRFEENVAGCEANGIPWGAYLYSYALNESDAKSEVQHALRLLKGKKPSYPVCFDMEDADGYKAKRGGLVKENLVKICVTFLSEMEKAGYYVSLYASLSWLDGYLKDKRLDPYDKWVAQWAKKCQYSGAYGLWQYGGSTNYIETPYVNGINGAVDKDYALYDYPTIIKEHELNGWEKPKTETSQEPTQTDEKFVETEKPQEDTAVETPVPQEPQETTKPNDNNTDENTESGILTTLKRLIQLIIKWAFGK